MHSIRKPQTSFRTSLQVLLYSLLHLCDSLQHLHEAVWSGSSDCAACLWCVNINYRLCWCRQSLPLGITARTDSLEQTEAKVLHLEHVLSHFVRRCVIIKGQCGQRAPLMRVHGLVLLPQQWRDAQSCPSLWTDSSEVRTALSGSWGLKREPLCSGWHAWDDTLGLLLNVWALQSVL